MHKSRLGTIIIDCQTDNLEDAVEFWHGVFGGTTYSHEGDDRYVQLRGDPAEPHVILQRVDHPSRIHIDIETDDIEAEVKRLEELGASVVGVMERWTVMQAPSGHRFCIIKARREGFDENANVWK